jgi:surface-anchored protein
VWIIPQTQRAGVLWTGWNTEELHAPEVTGQVTWRLTAVDGPGTAAIYTVNAFGDPSILFNNSDGLPDARDVPLGTHAHGNWAFTRAGTYRLTFEMSATLASGQVSTDTDTLAVTVADDEPAGPPGGGQSPGGGSTSPGGKPNVPLTLRLSSARLRGRSLRLRLRLSARSRVSASVRRSGRTVARARARDIPSGTHTITVRLNRRPRPGRYSVRVHAQAGGRTITRSIAVRVARREN